MTDSTRARAWWIYLLGGLLALAVHRLLPMDSLEQDLVYDAVGASAAVAIVAGFRLQHPERRAPWLLIAAGQAAFVIGDLLWVYFDRTGGRPFPSLADAFYLGGYPLLAVGFLLFIRRRIGGGDKSGLIDAAILTAGVAVVFWTFLMQPALPSADSDPLSLAISVAYPLGDLVLIGIALGLLTTPGARTASFALLVSALGLLFLADQAFAVEDLHGLYEAGGPLDVLWLLSYLAFGVAALHPSMRTLSVPHPVPVTWLGPVRVIFLSAAMLTGPVLTALGRIDAGGGPWVIAAGSALLSILVLARLVGLVRMLASDVDQRRTLEKKLSHQAFHDSLTGLANRRLFVERVEAALAARGQARSVAVLFLDLDDFKTVNDEMGHAAGDALLAAVAARLVGALRLGDLAARLGGDEFGILVTDLVGTDAAAVGERLLATLSSPVSVAGRAVPVGASIGVAVNTAQTGSADDLLVAADLAMYRAKAAGKGTVRMAPDVGSHGGLSGREARPAADRGPADVGATAAATAAELATGAGEPAGLHHPA